MRQEARSTAFVGDIHAQHMFTTRCATLTRQIVTLAQQQVAAAFLVGMEEERGLGRFLVEGCLVLLVLLDLLLSAHAIAVSQSRQ